MSVEMVLKVAGRKLDKADRDWLRMAAKDLRRVINSNKKEILKNGR